MNVYRSHHNHILKKLINGTLNSSNCCVPSEVTIISGLKVV